MDHPRGVRRVNRRYHDYLSGGATRNRACGLPTDYLDDRRLPQVPLLKFGQFILKHGCKQSEVANAPTHFAMVRLAEQKSIDLEPLLEAYEPGERGHEFLKRGTTASQYRHGRDGPTRSSPVSRVTSPRAIEAAAASTTMASHRHHGKDGPTRSSPVSRATSPRPLHSGPASNSTSPPRQRSSPMGAFAPAAAEPGASFVRRPVSQKPFPHVAALPHELEALPESPTQCPSSVLADEADVTAGTPDCMVHDTKALLARLAREELEALCLALLEGRPQVRRQLDLSACEVPCEFAVGVA